MVELCPLYFDHRDYAQKYTIEEIKHITQKHGFELVELKEIHMPYLASSANAYQRVDKVYCILAKKVKDVAPKHVSNSHLPAWITDIKKPIPKNDMIELSKGRADIFKLIYDEIDGVNGVGQDCTERC